MNEYQLRANHAHTSAVCQFTFGEQLQSMKKRPSSRDAFSNWHLSFAPVPSSVGVFLTLLALSVNLSSTARAAEANQSPKPIVIHSLHNDVSPALRDVEPWPDIRVQEHEAAANPRIWPGAHKDEPDLVVQDGPLLGDLPARIPPPILSFAGIPFPGVVCYCAPPDTTGEVGATQYVQVVNQGYQVFDKATGTSVLGPASIASVWTGFGGVCETSGQGDPVILYDQLANRWLISQFANGLLDECIAVSTTSDATGTWNRYDFHLSDTDAADYPKIGVWPDAYYMTANIFFSVYYHGPQSYAFDREKMLAGQPATLITFGAMGSPFPPALPADLDGSTLPPPGAPNSVVLFPGNSPPTYRVYHFHVDFANPTNSTFTLFGSSPATGWTALGALVPELGVTSADYLGNLADRLMFRLAYRNFGDHESLVGNWTVQSNNVAGIRWFELRGVTAGPITTFQESTYQPDSTWRWMGSVAMDKFGNMGLGFSASSATIHPQIRYTGRMATDPINTMPLGEAHIFDGGGSQTATYNRWGDYSDMTVDPVDDQTFWYTTEYYDTVSSFNWRTRIGNFKLGGGTGTLNLVSAASRLTHGAAGTFDISMPLSGTSGVEDRQATTYNAVFNFDTAVTSGQVTVLSGTATIGPITFSGNSMTAQLTGVTSAEIVTLHTENINGDGQPHGDVSFGFLTGDAGGDRSVAKPDQLLVKGDINQPVTSANFREDLDADGKIRNQDVQIVKTNKGHRIP